MVAGPLFPISPLSLHKLLPPKKPGMPNTAVHVYIPFGGISDETKRKIIDRLNMPNASFGFTQPQIVIAPPIAEAPSTGKTDSSAYPDHSQAKISEVVGKELEYGKLGGRGAALFVWAQGSVLQSQDPTAQVIYAEVPSSESAPLVVEEIRAEVGEIAAVLNCVESGNQSFGECQEWAGPDGVIRGEKSVEKEETASKAQESVPGGDLDRLELKRKMGN